MDSTHQIKRQHLTFFIEEAERVGLWMSWRLASSLGGGLRRGLRCVCGWRLRTQGTKVWAHWGQITIHTKEEPVGFVSYHISTKDELKSYTRQRWQWVMEYYNESSTYDSLQMIQNNWNSFFSLCTIIMLQHTSIEGDRVTVGWLTGLLLCGCAVVADWNWLASPPAPLRHSHLPVSGAQRVGSPTKTKYIFIYVEVTI